MSDAIKAALAEAGSMTLRDWFAGQALAGIMAHPVYGSDVVCGFSERAVRAAYDAAAVERAAREGGG